MLKTLQHHTGGRYLRVDDELLAFATGGEHRLGAEGRVERHGRHRAMIGAHGDLRREEVDDHHFAYEKQFPKRICNLWPKARSLEPNMLRGYRKQSLL